MRGGNCFNAQADYECDPGYEIVRMDAGTAEQRPPPVRSANRVCSQSGVWLPEELIQCVKTRCKKAPRFNK